MTTISPELPRAFTEPPADPTEQQQYDDTFRREHQPMSHYILNAYTGVKAALAVRRYNMAEQWDTLSATKQRIYKAGMFITSAAGLATIALSLRVTGAAAHEAASFTDGLSIGGNAHALPALEVNQHANADTGTLPADLDESPDAKALGDWQPEAGKGTIWDQAVGYADSLGYSKLTEHQKWELTDKVLDENNLSWNDARHLNADYKPDMPSQHAMLDELKEVEAKHTHAADRATVGTDPGNDEGGANGSDTDDGSHSSESDDPVPDPAPTVNDANKNGIPDSIEAESKAAANAADNKLDGFQKWVKDHTPIWHIPQQIEELRNLNTVFPAWWQRNSLTVASLVAILVGAKMADNYRQHGDFASRNHRRVVLPAPSATSPVAVNPTNSSATTVTNGPPVAQEKHPIAKKIVTAGALMFLRNRWEAHKKKKKDAKAAKATSSTSN